MPRLLLVPRSPVSRCRPCLINGTTPFRWLRRRVDHPADARARRPLRDSIEPARGRHPSRGPRQTLSRLRSSGASARPLAVFMATRASAESRGGRLTSLSILQANFAIVYYLSPRYRGSGRSVGGPARRLSLGGLGLPRLHAGRHRRGLSMLRPVSRVLGLVGGRGEHRASPIPHPAPRAATPREPRLLRRHELGDTH